MAEATQVQRYERAKDELERVGQAHVLSFYDELDAAGQARLLDQVESVDWPEVDRLIATHVRVKPETRLPEQIEPAPWYPVEPDADLAPRYHDARKLGERLVREGKVAVFTVAGGQGTRLGWDAPKGTFPATPIRKAPLFAIFAEAVRKMQRKFGCTLPWYVMTSPHNDAATRAFFAEQAWFDLDPGQITFFAQGMMPALDRDSAKVFMEDRDRIALSPNGHGGSLKALASSGAIASMQEQGIEQISYIQIDNPHVRVIDPLFLGLHALDDAQMSSKMLPKAYPEEKLGNFCLVDGKVTIIEYSDLPDELAQQRRPDGGLRFRAGSIAVHAMRVDFVASLTRAEGFSLPYHRAEKKVAHIDLETGQTIRPESANAVKLETFVFDALPLCDRSIVYETDRVEEFAPIKNAEGVDSPASSRVLQIERAARWLEAQGVAVPRRDEPVDEATGLAKVIPRAVDATLEVRPLTAVDMTDLEKVKLPERVEAGGELLL
ncbi:MAG: UDPGP type 1 family protein [Phycisphaeraceae bacterium]